MIVDVRTRFSIIVVATVLLVAGAGCAPIAATAPTPAAAVPVTSQSSVCTMQDGTAITSAFQPFTTRWGDAVALVDSTPRIALSGPVGQLQQIRRDVEAAQWPLCARRAADLLVQGMDSEIDGYLGLMAGHAADETKTLPDVGTLSYGYLSQTSGVAEANRVFDADNYAAIVRGRRIFADFGTELAYAAGEEPRPE
jgi:hypothetical protein